MTTEKTTTITLFTCFEKNAGDKVSYYTITERHVSHKYKVTEDHHGSATGQPVNSYSIDLWTRLGWIPVITLADHETVQPPISPETESTEPQDSKEEENNVVVEPNITATPMTTEEAVLKVHHFIKPTPLI